MTMNAFPLAATVILLLITLVATEETMTIEGRLQYPDKTPFNITTRITLNHDEYTTYSRRDGQFSIYNVVPGIHVLDIHSPTHHFSQVKCQFKPDAEEGKPVFSCLEYVYPGAQKQVLGDKLDLTAWATYEYFEERRGFSIFSIFKNPMILMMLFTVGLMYFMPKMMEGLEPEERERMQKQMEMQQNPTKMIGELFGGMGGGEPEPETKSKQRKSKK